MASDGPSPHPPPLRLSLAAHQPSRRHPAQSLLDPSFHDPSQEFWTSHVLESHPERATSLPPRRWATTCCRLWIRPCTAPLSCSLQPLLKLSFLSLAPSLPICLNHCTLAESRKPDLWTFVCVFTFTSSAFAFLTEMDFSFESLFVICPLLLQRFHYDFYLSIVSWQYQKFWTILIILVLCLLCVTPLVSSD